MPDELKCNQCGRPVRKDYGQAICARCLLALGLEEEKRNHKTAGPVGKGTSAVNHGRQMEPRKDEVLAELRMRCRASAFVLLRRRGYQSAEAGTFAREFLAWCLEHDLLVLRTPEEIRLRFSFERILDEFLANKRLGAETQELAGPTNSLPVPRNSGTSPVRPRLNRASRGRRFEQERAWGLCALTFQRLCDEYEEAGKGSLFAGLRGCCPGLPDTCTTREAAAKLNLTEDEVREAARQMLERFRELLRMEIAAAGTSKEEIDEEIRYLMTVLGRE
jgi:hypothetical protein